MTTDATAGSAQYGVNRSRRGLLRGVAGLAVALPAIRALSTAEAAEPTNHLDRRTQHTMGEYRLITDQLTTPEGPIALADGSVLVCEMVEGRVSRVTPDGRVIPLPSLGGAPNGAAIGPDGACYVTNNGGFNSARGPSGKLEMRPGLPPGYKGGSIQRIDLKSGDIKTLYTQVDGKNLRGPNDLVFDESGGFYFTDMGKILGDDTLDFGALCWARPDGSEIRKLAGRLLTPNGIALSPDRRTLYVALTEKRQVLAFHVVGPGQLEVDDKGRARREVLVSIGGDLAFDSMKVEQNGNLVVGTLLIGCLSVFSPSGTQLRQIFLPDPGVTNLAFGGPRLRTAYVTLTNTGRLVAVAWPRPGLKLEFQDLQDAHQSPA
jgi:gluconolactonase